MPEMLAQCHVQWDEISEGVTTPFSLIVAIHLNKQDEDILDEGIVVVYHASQSALPFLVEQEE